MPGGTTSKAPSTIWVTRAVLPVLAPTPIFFGIKLRGSTFVGACLTLPLLLGPLFSFSCASPNIPPNNLYSRLATCCTPLTGLLALFALGANSTASCTTFSPETSISFSNRCKTFLVGILQRVLRIRSL